MTNPEIGRIYLLHNEATGLTLAAAERDDPQSTVYAASYTPWDPHQGWRLAAAPDQAYAFDHPHSGWLLDTEDRRVHLSKPNGGPSQRWLIRDDGEGRWTVRNVASGLALETNPDGEVYTTTPSDSARQRWRFVWI